MTTRIARQPTTQFTARLPNELHTWLAERARNNHRSANAELAAILDALRVQETPNEAIAAAQATLLRLTTDARATFMRMDGGLGGDKRHTGPAPDQ